jgi:hypothetical protein
MAKNILVRYIKHGKLSGKYVAPNHLPWIIQRAGEYANMDTAEWGAVATDDELKQW